MKYSEDMIGDVREYLQGEVEEAREYLYDIGQEWCKVYDLQDLYNDYCWGDLASVINLFVESRLEATDYEEYFVQGGEVAETCNLEDAVWEILDDDDIVERIIECAVDGTISASDDLMDIINKGHCSWQNVDDAMRKHFHNMLESERESFKDPEYANEAHEFAKVVRLIEDAHNAFFCLLNTKFFGIAEERYADIVSILDGNPNWLMGVGITARGHIGAGITFEKGVEMYLKNDSSWFDEESDLWKTE